MKSITAAIMYYVHKLKSKDINNTFICVCVLRERRSFIYYASKKKIILIRLSVYLF